MLKQLIIASFLLVTFGVAASVTVRSGDTLGSLAVRYNTNVATLMKLNSLATPNLTVGQQLRLPENATVRVEAGDTLEGIAARLGVSVTSIQQANNLSGDGLRVNQTLRLPSSGGRATGSNAWISSSKIVIYTVQAGDTLSAIAARFKVSVAAIQSASALRSDALSLGQQLRIPTVQAALTTSAVSQRPVLQKPVPQKPVTVKRAVVKPIIASPHVTVAKPSAQKPAITTATSGIVTVRRGDTLSSIARASGVSIALLRQLNNLTSDALALGQRVRTAAVPVSSAPKPSPKPALSVISPPASAKPSVAQPVASRAAPNAALVPAAAMDINAIGVMPTAPSDVLEDQTSYRIVEPINPPAQINRFERLLWPISGVLTSRYGYRWGRLHAGLDIAAPTGTGVYAALSGTVQFAGWNRFGYGHLVVIRGVDSRLYYYAHNSRLLVTVGQFVPQGRMISKSGSTGNSTGPHLHFEVRVGGVARNPMAYLPSSQVLQARFAGK